MTPADRAATVREDQRLSTDAIDRLILRSHQWHHPERELPEGRKCTACEAAAEVLALAERVTELERDLDWWAKSRDEERALRTAAEARATELERKLASATIACNVAVTQAERAERERDHWQETYKQEHRTRHAMEDEIARLRAALGETAS